MLIQIFLILSSVVFAQNSSKTDKRVNEHLQKTHKKIEIEAQKKELELRKDAPKNLYPQNEPKKKAPFIVYPKKVTPDPEVMDDQYNHSIGQDPSMEFEESVLEQRNAPTAEEENREFIRQFKENAEKSGIKVEVDPKTLKARPIKNNGNN